MKTVNRNYLTPDWPAPNHVRAFTTTRSQGHSQKPFHEFNFANYVGDDSEAVDANINELTNELNLQEAPRWLHQVHGTTVLRAEDCINSPDADASFTQQKNKVCVVMTADCLPILLCNRSGTEVAAVHAGWKGLLAGVIDSSIAALHSSPDDLLAWMGPALGPKHFEVGDEVRADFINKHPDNIKAFMQHGARWHLDFYKIGTMNLQRCGVTQIYGGEHCTFTEENDFFSFRRDNGVTGRMANLIWIT